jgi:hypothetical protein
MGVFDIDWRPEGLVAIPQSKIVIGALFGWPGVNRLSE